MSGGGGEGPDRMLPVPRALSRSQQGLQLRLLLLLQPRRSREPGAGSSRGQEPGVAGGDAPALSHTEDPGLPAPPGPPPAGPPLPSALTSWAPRGRLPPSPPSHQHPAGGKVGQHADRTAAGTMEEDRGGAHGERGACGERAHCLRVGDLPAAHGRVSAAAQAQCGTVCGRDPGT